MTNYVLANSPRFRVG